MSTAGFALFGHQPHVADRARDRAWARRHALSLLAGLRAHVRGRPERVAADLDVFDDGVAYVPASGIGPRTGDQNALRVPGPTPADATAGSDEPRWLRQIRVRPFPGVATRDLRVCTVRVFRLRAGEPFPGTRVCEVSNVIRTGADPSAR